MLLYSHAGDAVRSFLDTEFTKTMKNKIGIWIMVFCIAGISVDAQQAAKRIDSLVNALYNRGQFNGSILVSVRGKVLYEKAKGKAYLQTGADFTLNIPCYVASVSKQFAAITVMMLQEKYKLKLDDVITKYIPGLPAWAQTVTIKHLLNHTSGIVNYEQLGIDHPGITNQEVISKISKLTALRSQPDQKYEYSNTGYVLLAVIIEKVSGMSYAEFLDKYIFKPLKMDNTFVFTPATQAEARATAYGKFGGISDYGGFTTGDGGIFSTVEDMFIWDKTLFTGKLVSRAALNEAFRPAILTNGTQSPYGYGWMLKDENGEKIVYHTGGSGGFRTYNELQLNSQIAIIILTNNENSHRTDIRNAIVNILHNRSSTLPRISVATKMNNIRNQLGLDSAINFYRQNKQHDDGIYDFAEQELNLLGYKYLSENKVDDAVRIFQLNVGTYPGSSNAIESLGEAYLQHGDKKAALEEFNKSLSIDPNNADAIRMLKKINN